MALNFVISYLYSKLPRRRVNMFGEELEKGLKIAFEGHWYPDKPTKGSAFRCIRVSGEKVDPVIESSVLASGLDIEEVKEYLPHDLTIWIDPCEVSYRIGEKGVVKILYSEKSRKEEGDSADREVQNTNRGFNPEAQSFRPIDSLSSSLGNLSLSPSPNGWSPEGGSPMTANPNNNAKANSTSPVTSFLNRNAHATQFTAATFAATKFGSTKLKTQAKRPTRLSPTEISANFRQRGTFQFHSPTQVPSQTSPLVPPPMGPWQSPSSLSPGHSPFGKANGPTRSLPVMTGRDPRQEFMEHQQRIHLLQQQQQQQLQQSPQRHFMNLQLQQQQQHSGNSLLPAGSLSPIGGPAALQELYGPGRQQSPGLSPTTSPSGPSLLGGELLPSPQDNSSKTSLQQSPSPSDGNKTFLDNLNWNPLPQQYANLQHLLVAN